MRTVPTAFTTATRLSDEDLRAGGPHYPRPERLDEELEVNPAPAARGAERLGLDTVGDLLEHLPRDRGQARTVAELAAGEVATVVVEVRSIRSRPVRRRGMRPLVEAVVADETGVMKATFFNQPWLERKYRAGTRLMLNGKYEARNRFRVQAHAPTAQATGAEGDVATYPATEGLSSTQILALVREHAAALRDVVEPLPAAAAGARAPARPRRRAAGRPLRRPRGRPPAAGVRGAAARPDRAAAPARRPPRGGARRAARRASRADAPAGWRRRCPSRPPTTSGARWTPSTTTSPRTARCSGC